MSIIRRYFMVFPIASAAFVGYRLCNGMDVPWNWIIWPLVAPFVMVLVAGLLLFILLASMGGD